MSRDITPVRGISRILGGLEGSGDPCQDAPPLWSPWLKVIQVKVDRPSSPGSGPCHFPSDRQKTSSPTTMATTMAPMMFQASMTPVSHASAARTAAMWD
jgi:hypothetical protein